MISCGHCGGRHATVAEVRSCSGAPVATGAEASPEPTPPAGRVTRRMVEPVALEADWWHLAGPPGLGRNVIVRAGQPTPEPWADAPRVLARDEPDTLAELRRHRRDRRAVVIELATDLPPPIPSWRSTTGISRPTPISKARRYATSYSVMPSMPATQRNPPSTRSTWRWPPAPARATAKAMS